MTNLIKNRVKYHAPINFYDDVDFEKIMSLGIDLSLPVFIMEKPFNSVLLTAFYEAQKEVDFNLILNKKNKKVQRKIKHCYVLNPNEIKVIEKLNINYKSYSNYYKVEKGNFLRVGKIIEDFDEKDFFLEKKDFVDGIFVVVKKFLISGENYMIEMSNCSNVKRQIEIEYNHELKRGYYIFEKLRSGVKIIDLYSREKQFFNANFGKFEESYSCIDGLENSTFARINAKTKIELKPFEKKCFFINFGKQCFSLKNQNDMNFLFNLSKLKNYEIFDIKVTSKDKVFENKFNNVLPLKIWRAWLSGERDVESENTYVDLKNQIVFKKKRKVVLLKNDFKIEDVLIYNGKYYKKIAESV